MPSLDTLHIIEQELAPYDARLIAVSKTRSLAEIQEVYDADQRLFGENRVQEMREKHPALPEDIEWHAIGHLQSNKVKYIAPYISLIHSVESEDLLKEINKRAEQNDRVIDVLLQMHIATESSKFGMDERELNNLIELSQADDFANIRVCGLMGMATFTDDAKQVRKEFKALRKIFDRVKGAYYSGDEHFKEVSMGMSGDYMIALEEGSTMVRIGSLIFG